MEFALTNEKKFIHARNARRSETYFCPVCETAMILCDGLKKTAYFRHPDGAECEKIIRNSSSFDYKPTIITSDVKPKEETETPIEEKGEEKGKTLEELWQMNFRIAIFENIKTKTQFKIFDDQAKIGLISKKWYGFMKSKNSTYTKKQVEVFYSNEPQWKLNWRLTFQEAEY